MNKWQLNKTDQKYFINVNAKSIPCQIGRNGIIAKNDKREGDLCTPSGLWNLRKLYYRKDKINFIFDKIKNKIAINKISKNCGWCDDKNSKFYNKKIKIIENNIFFHGRYEKLWREDDTYDIFFELGFNDCPVIKGMGSAIFLHCSFDDLRPTSGCIAISKESFEYILNNLKVNTYIEIEEC